MVEPTIRLAPAEHLSRLSRVAEELRSQFEAYRAGASRDPSVPASILAGLRQLSGSLQVLRGSAEEAEVERANLSALADVGRVVNSSLDLPTVLAEVIDTLIHITGAERAFLMLRENGQLQVRVARNWEGSSIGPGDEAFSRTVIDRVERLEEPVLTTNARTDPRFAAQESIVAHNLRSILCVPLKAKGAVIGVIYADSRAREGLFSEKDRALLAAFADQAAVALENARLFASVESTLAQVTDLKNLMEDVFASIASGVITSDVDDRIQLCNRAAERILGRPAASLLGTSMSDFLPTLAAGLGSGLEAVRQRDEKVIGLEVRPELEGRGQVTLAVSLAPLRTVQGEVHGVTVVLDDLTDKRRLEATRRLFERMVSPAVIDQLDPERIQLGGRVEEITVVFADLGGFTALGETVDPQTLMAGLNRYLAAAADAILEEQGTIDKFLGDAVMAWFNAPIPQPDHRLKAARAALGILRRVGAMRDEMPDAFRLQFRVGIHSGPALLGLVGTESRLEYTAIGDTVNTAKRLQEEAAPGQILVSHEAAAAVLPSLTAVEVPDLTVHGKRTPLKVWELRGLRRTD